MRFRCFLFLAFFVISTQAQLIGTITDKETGMLLCDIPVVIVNTTNNDKNIVYSDSLGVYFSKLKHDGLFTVSVCAMGYQEVYFDNLALSSALVKNLDISLERKYFSLEEVVVIPSAWGVDKVGGISSYEINPHIMNLTVGSSYDILRSATLIPGVSNTSDASNDLNIRGNSPFGINWYVEDVPVVSPNHFTDNNSSAGVFSIFDSWGVNKAQLFVSAFPSEYGNAISGILNTELRVGNLQELQGSVNVSTISAGGTLEMPIVKDKSSIIGGFRYSFPTVIHKIFPSYSEKLGTVPDVLDGFVKFHSVLNQNLKLSMWAIGGNSDAAFEYVTENEQLLSLRRKGGSMSSGLSLTYSKSSFSIKTNAYTSHRNNHEYVINKHVIDSEAGWSGVSAKLTFLNANSKIQIGSDFKRQYYNQYRDIFPLNRDSIHTAFVNDFSTFLTYTHYFKRQLQLQMGVHYWYSGIAEQYRVEPRMKLLKYFESLGSVSLGFGEHSVNSPIQYLYSYEQVGDNDDGIVMRNKVDIPLMKSRHYVLGWDKKYNNGIKIGSELFYQHIYDASNKVLSEGYTHNPYSYGGIALGAPSVPPTEFATGRNYGIEISVDAPFSSKRIYYYLAGTLFNSEYKFSDGEWTPTLFNSNFSLTSAFRKEFIVNKNSKLITGLNYFAQGGRRYTPIDQELTEQYQQMVYNEGKINSCKYPYYGRLDCSISLNAFVKKLSHSFTIEVQNVLNRENVLERYEYYSADPVEVNQVMRVLVYKYILSF
ncbi:MAG: carboxypeptidase-like regulatory domain-containing protein [Bacteroidales bacterium]|nr:carboxypeptidase-like regulatory domain-containing protein [Bacteroidales bacterium]